MRSRSELLSMLLKEGGKNNNNNSSSNNNNSSALGSQSNTSTVSVPTSAAGEELLQLFGYAEQKSTLKRKLMQEEQSLKRPHPNDVQNPIYVIKFLS